MGTIQIKQGEEIVLGGYQTSLELLYKQIMPKDTTKQEFGLFLAIAKSYELNPYKREIYAVKYGSNPMQIVCGYETYIKRAEHSGKLDGWEVEIADDDQSATITIHRNDWKHPFKWTVERAEFDKAKYAKSDKNTWLSMPRFMLKKVAIGQGFRLCFSDEMGGMPYLQEEVTAGIQEATVIDSEYEEIINENEQEQDTSNGNDGGNKLDRQRKKAFAIASKLFITDAEMKADIQRDFQKESRKDMEAFEWERYANQLLEYENKEIDESQLAELNTLLLNYAETYPNGVSNKTFIVFINRELAMIKGKLKNQDGKPLSHKPIRVITDLKAYEANYVMRLMSGNKELDDAGLFDEATEDDEHKDPTA